MALPAPPSWQGHCVFVALCKGDGIDPAKFKERIDKMRAARGGPRFAEGDSDNDSGDGKIDVYG